MAKCTTRRRDLPRAPRPGGRRGAALFLTVLAVSTLLAMTGYMLIAVQRGDRQLQNNLVRISGARWCARAGIELALLYMERVPTWRQQVSGDTLLSDVPVGAGRVTVRVFDDSDGSITDDPLDSVRLVSVGKREACEYCHEARLVPRSHPALKYALFQSGGGEMEFKGHAVARGPVRSHARIRGASGVGLRDDASFETMTGYEIESPLTPQSFSASALSAPAVDLSAYLAMATPITGSYGSRCELKGYNLTPSNNPTGAANPYGIYALDAGGREVLCENLHVRGTLVIYGTGDKNVTFRKGLWLEPGPLKYPVLMVNSPLNEMMVHPDNMSFSELSISVVIGLNGLNVSLGLGCDFNEDGDVLDSITTQVRGIVWTNANRVFLENGSWPFIGCLISSGERVTVDDDVTVDNDLTLLDTLIPGFTQDGMSIVAGSYREVAP